MPDKIVQGISAINRWVAKYFSLLILPQMLIVAADTILRYVFDRPLVWSWDVNQQILGAMAVMAGGYALLERSHVGVDVITQHLSPKSKAILDLITCPLFFIGMVVLLWRSGDMAITSIMRKEVMVSANTPLYYLRVIMVIGVALFLLQGIAKVIEDINIVRGRKVVK